MALTRVFFPRENEAFYSADSCFLFYLMVFKITVKPQCNNVLEVVVELANTDYIEITE